MTVYYSRLYKSGITQTQVDYFVIHDTPFARQHFAKNRISGMQIKITYMQDMKISCACLSSVCHVETLCSTKMPT